MIHRLPMDDLLPLVYAELKRIAAQQLRSERPNHTLSATALVHEAWLELSNLDRIKWQNRNHYLALASQAMRRVLVDHAVARSAQKRGGGQQMQPLQDEPAVMLETTSEELLDVENALQRLAVVDERQVRIVECRFFGGMSIEETAAALCLSPATVKREWALARAWLNRELSP